VDWYAAETACGRIELQPGWQGTPLLRPAHKPDYHPDQIDEGVRRKCIAVCLVFCSRLVGNGMGTVGGLFALGVRSSFTMVAPAEALRSVHPLCLTTDGDLQSKAFAVLAAISPRTARLMEALPWPSSKCTRRLAMLRQSPRHRQDAPLNDHLIGNIQNARGTSSTEHVEMEERQPIVILGLLGV